jgi:hypothetical protein
LNELVGTTAVDSGATPAANGTYTGGLTLGKPGIDATRDSGSYSVLFGGASGYIDVGALPSKLQFSSGTDFSIEAWCAFDKNVTPGVSLVTEAYAGDGNVRYMLGFTDGSSPTQTPSFGWYNGAWRLVQGTTALVDSAWHHLVGTYTGSSNTLELWVDGVSQGTLVPGGTQPTGTENLYIGRRWDNGAGTYWNGYIDEVAMYGFKLSSGQIGAHAGASAPISGGLAVTRALVEGAAYRTSGNKILTTREVVEAGAFTSTNVKVSATRIVIETAIGFDISGPGIILYDEAVPDVDMGLAD